MLERSPVGTARVLVWIWVAGIFSVPDMAAAQSSLSSGESASLVRVGQMVWVTTLDGRHVDGKVGSVSGQELVVQTDAVTRLSWAEVGAIETQTADSIVDGLAKGAMIGGLSGGLGSVLIMGTICSGCSYGSEAMRVAMVGAGIGAAIGALVDSSRHSRKQVYKASPSVSVAPVLAPKAVAISGVVSW